MEICQGDGKELCIYFSTENYYYAIGSWKNDILTSGTASNRRIDLNTNEIFIRSGNIKNNKYYSYITLTTIDSHKSTKEEDIMPGCRQRLSH